METLKLVVLDEVILVFQDPNLMQKSSNLFLRIIGLHKVRLPSAEHIPPGLLPAGEPLAPGVDALGHLCVQDSHDL